MKKYGIINNYPAEANSPQLSYANIAPECHWVLLGFYLAATSRVLLGSYFLFEMTRKIDLKGSDL